MDDSYQLYLDRLNVQDILYYAGYRQNRRDGLRYPSFSRVDSDGRRVRGDKFICMPVARPVSNHLSSSHIMSSPS